MLAKRAGALDLTESPAAPARRILVMTFAVVGFALNFWAWELIAPLAPVLARRYGFAGWAVLLLVSVVVLVGAVGRIPAGALTDRFGGRVMLPVVSVATAVAVLALASARSLPALVVAAAGLGVAGTAFAVGAALVARAYPPGRRGFALSLFGAGMGGASAANLAAQRFAAVDGDAAVWLAGLLLAYAALAAVLIHDPPAARTPRGSMVRAARAVWRLPGTRRLSLWYAVGFGGLLALGLYLPAFLHDAYRIGGHPAVLVTAAVLGVAAVARPVGGWLSDRRDPARMLMFCFTGAAVLVLLLAFDPPLLVATAAVLGVGGCLGLASGTVLALIGRTAPTDRIGIIAGTIGAAGGLAGLFPPLLLYTVYGLDGSYAIGLTLLAAAALAAAAHLRGQARWIGATLTGSVEPVDPVALADLADPADPAEPTDPADPVVVAVTADAAARNPHAVVAILGTLATQRELVIVYPYAPTPGAPTPSVLVSGLRAQLPRYTVVAVYVDTPPRREELNLLADLLNQGSVVVAVPPAGDLDAVSARVAGQFGAGRTLYLTYDRVEGVRLEPPRTAGMLTAGP